MNNFITYRTFPNQEMANELAALLEKHGIASVIKDNTPPVAHIFITHEIGDHILLKIDPDDFVRANEIMNDDAGKLVDEISEDHYLFTFENQELLTVIIEVDKWNELDRQLALKILNSRGVTVTKEMENTLLEQRLKELTTTKEGNRLWIITGYIMAFCGGIIGAAIGLNYWQSKRTLPDGKRVFVYDKKSRENGLYITILGIISFIASLYLRSMNDWHLYEIINR